MSSNIKHLGASLAGTRVTGKVLERGKTKDIAVTIRSNNPKNYNNLVVEDSETGRVLEMPIPDVLWYLIDQNPDAEEWQRSISEIASVSMAAHTEACRLAAETMALSPDIPKQVLEDIREAVAAIGRAQSKIKTARQIAQSSNWDREDDAKRDRRRGRRF